MNFDGSREKTLKGNLGLDSHPYSRWWGSAVVLGLHGLALVALLLHDYIRNPAVIPNRPMTLLFLRPEKPLRPNPVAISIPRSAPPVSVNLPVPQITILPPEMHRPSPITVTPEERVVPTPPTRQGTPNYNDLFSADKKAQLKQFFDEQAVVDRRENAKAGKSKTGCDAFNKPDDLGEAGERSNTGIPKNFKPGLVIGVGGGKDDDVAVHACN